MRAASYAFPISAPAVAAEIARQLLAADRLEEAANVLKAAAPSAGRRGHPPAVNLEWESAWIEVLSAGLRRRPPSRCGWESFRRTLTPDRLRANLERLPDFDDAAAGNKAVALAAAHSDFRRGLRFLMEWPALDAAGRMVEDRATQSVVDPEEAERWAAKLRRRQPRAANLLLRRAAAQAFARREFKLCERLTEESRSHLDGVRSLPCASRRRCHSRAGAADFRSRKNALSFRPMPFSNPLRYVLVNQVRSLVGGTGDDRVERNRADTGYFGPQSACWKVHGDFTSMMVGGISALLLQMLHPRALAGVWDHSNFQRDMLGRLGRTARFIAGTTYGDRAEAQALIDRVRAIHRHVTGQLPNGQAYAADDPELLTWVHVTEVSSFLAAYLRYADPRFPQCEQDRYFREVAEIAFRLGAKRVPQSRAEVAAYLARQRPELCFDERTAQVAAALLAQPAPSLAARPAMSLAFEAAKDLLPDWAADMHGFQQAAVRRAAARAGVSTLGKTLRWALVNGAEARARRRAEQLLAAEPVVARQDIKLKGRRFCQDSDIGANRN